MICVSLAEPSKEKLLDEIKKYNMAEIRIDQLEDKSDESIKKIFSSHNNLIATFRKVKVTEKVRISTLIKAIESGAKYVDIEVEADLINIKKVIKTAKKNNCIPIVSYHNYQETPEIDTLLKYCNSCKESGAEIIKIATKTNSFEDNKRILSLYSKYDNLIAIGMGTFGKITRIASIYLGAPFTFVSNGETCTAPGQIDYNTFKKITYLIDNE